MKTNTRLLNRSACRSYALALIASRRAHLAGKITRVSGRYLVRLQGHLMALMQREIDAMPSKGKTLLLLAPSPGADPHGPRGRGEGPSLAHQVPQAGRRHRFLGVAANFPELSLQASAKTTAMIYLFVDGLDEVLVAQAFFGRNELAHRPGAVSWTGMLIEG